MTVNGGVLFVIVQLPAIVLPEMVPPPVLFAAVNPPVMVLPAQLFAGSPTRT